MGIHRGDFSFRVQITKSDSLAPTFMIHAHTFSVIYRKQLDIVDSTSKAGSLMMNRET